MAYTKEQLVKLLETNDQDGRSAHDGGNGMKDYVKTLSTETLRQIGKDWDEFSLVGSIGDCTLRQLATEQMKLAKGNKIENWMYNLAFDAYSERLFRARKEFNHW